MVLNNKGDTRKSQNYSTDYKQSQTCSRDLINLAFHHLGGMFIGLYMAPRHDGGGGQWVNWTDVQHNET